MGKCGSERYISRFGVYGFMEGHAEVRIADELLTLCGSGVSDLSTIYTILHGEITSFALKSCCFSRSCGFLFSV